ncbi:MAG: hypothetical protein EOO73_06340 [Myxococcales bacterium]|nr:MAG: hypothetical protein EOO73_06340 [Myxococcales bacterium]
MSPTKKATKSAPKRRSTAPSSPEVKLGYAAAGRETLAAIDAELAMPARTAEAPVIEISEAPAGRETLAAITLELAEAARPRQDTLPYGDRISNAPGARSPSRAPAPPSSVKPRVPRAPAPAAEASVNHTPAASATVPLAAPEALEIFELVTFIVRGNQVGELSTDLQRRRFVEAHLLGRVPGGKMENVERIEVTPWTAKGTMVVRVWCRT